MGTGYSTRYTINGLLKTENTALANLAQIADASGCWVTYDTHEGKFAVVINQAGTAGWHFDDSNIIGAINIAYTPLDKLYNTVKVNYPHEDLKGQTDWVQIAIPTNQRQANEYENVLMRDYGIVTNPVQAELLGFIELKQARVDRVVSFKTDYSKMGIKAGDLFDITNELYGWTAKMFRVISVSESDSDDGAIIISITGLEYDDSVYDEDLTRYVRTDSSGIIPLASLPAPTKPIVTVSDSLKTITITTSIIGGIVTELEFMRSSDTTLADNLRSYSLLKTYVSTEPITPNTVISITVESANASTFVCKVRSKNSDGVSQFSLPSDVAYYQGTDIVTNNTKIIDPTTGQSLLNQLGMAGLLKLLNSMMGGANGTAQDTGPGSLFKKIADTLKSTGQGGGIATVVPTTAAREKLGLNTSVDANTMIASLDSNFTLTASPAAIAAGITVERTGEGQWRINFSGTSVGNLPAEGTLLSTYCDGTTKMGIYMPALDHRVIATNSVECGYVIPGTPVGTMGDLFHPAAQSYESGYLGPDTYYKNSWPGDMLGTVGFDSTGNVGCNVVITGPVSNTTMYDCRSGTFNVESLTYDKICTFSNSSSNPDIAYTKSRCAPGHYVITFNWGAWTYAPTPPYAGTFTPGLSVDGPGAQVVWNFVILDQLVSGYE